MFYKNIKKTTIKSLITSKSSPIKYSTHTYARPSLEDTSRAFKEIRFDKIDSGNLWRDNLALEDLVTKGYVSKAEEQFNRMGSTVGRDSSTYSIMFPLYAFDPDSIEKLLRLSRKDGVELNESLLCTLISVYLKGRHVHKIQQLINDSEETGIKFGIRAINELIHAFCVLGNFTAARHVFEKIKHQQLHPNIQTFNNMLALNLQEGNLSQTMHTILEMRKRNITPNSASFLVLITAQLRALPDREHHTFDGLYANVERTIELIQRFGISNTSKVALIMLRYWITNSIEEDKKSEKEKKKLDTDPILDVDFQNIPFSSPHIKKYIRMAKKSGTPNAQFYELLFLYHVNHNFDIERIKELLEEMVTYEVQPTKKIFHFLLSKFAKKSPELVNIILSLMAAHQVKPDADTYAMLMLMDHSNWSYIQKVAKDMKEAGIKPNASFYYHYIRFTISCNKEAQITSILEEMRGYGIQLTSEISAILFKRIVKKKAFTSATTILEKMIATNSNYHFKNIDTLISEMIQLNDLQAAVTIVKNLLDSSISFNKDNIIRILQAYKKRKYKGRAYAIKLSLFFLSKAIDNTQHYDIDSYYITRLFQCIIHLAFSFQLSSMQIYRAKAFREGITKVPPHLWDFQSKLNFFTFVRNIAAENTVEEVDLPTKLDLEEEDEEVQETQETQETQENE